MTKKYVSVSFAKHDSIDVIAQVETELSGIELEDSVRIPDEWWKEFFGDEWERWEVDEVMEVTDDWSILKDRTTDAAFDRELNEAPLFEIASDEERKEKGS